MQTTTIILQIRNLYCILRLNLNIYYNTILSLSIKKKRTIHIQTTTTTKKHTNNSKQNKTNPSPHPANKCKLSNIKGRVPCKQNIVRCYY